MFVIGIFMATQVAADNNSNSSNPKIGPDLKINKLKFFEFGPYLIVKGCIKNIGPEVAIGPIEMSLRLIRPSGAKLGSGGLMSYNLVPGAKVCTKSKFLNLEGEVGKYKVKFIADPNNLINETNEGNNKKKKKLIVSISN